MARAKEHWDGTLNSYGPVFFNGKLAGFRVTVLAYDHTESGRMVTFQVTAGQLRRMTEAAERAEEREDQDGT